eukprot:3344824-Rhodomonas_salina.1
MWRAAWEALAAAASCSSARAPPPCPPSTPPGSPGATASESRAAGAAWARGPAENRNHWVARAVMMAMNSRGSAWSAESSGLKPRNDAACRRPPAQAHAHQLGTATHIAHNTVDDGGHGATGQWQRWPVERGVQGCFGGGSRPRVQWRAWRRLGGGGRGRSRAPLQRPCRRPRHPSRAAPAPVPAPATCRVTWRQERDPPD